MVSSIACQRILVVEDHQYILESSAQHLQQYYASAQIVTAMTAQQAMEQLAQQLPDILISDLAVPAQQGKDPESENGIQLLRNVLKHYPELNIAVLSGMVKVLIRIKPLIDKHEGGFVIIPKNLPMSEILKRIDLALQGAKYVRRELRTGLEIQPEWLKLLNLACGEGWQDKAIAQRMNISERTVRRYWEGIQDTLDIHADPGSNMRAMTCKYAREEGLID